MERNRAKRILRAAYDTLRPSLRTGHLIVISARGAIVGRTSTDLEDELRVAFSKLELLRSSVPASASRKTESKQ